MCLLASNDLNELRNKRVLLAFSAGADSTALFFSLLNADIPFDIAIVHYGIRTQADEEVAYAQTLAKQYNLHCHLLKANTIDQNFEHEARRIRYEFFERLIHTHNYDYLITAHHLQDRLEWMLMQLCKGAGSAELLGMQRKEIKREYTLFRPFLDTSKEDILSYLRENDLHWFYDESNDELGYRRNYFRHKIADDLIKEYSQGIKQSFAYLEADVSKLIHPVQIHQADEMRLFKSSYDKRSDIFHIDKILKEMGYMLNATQRRQLEDIDELVVGRKFLIVFYEGVYTVSPYIQEVMEKAFKEECRQLKVPKKLRPYLFVHPLAFILFTRFLPCSINVHSER